MMQLITKATVAESELRRRADPEDHAISATARVCLPCLESARSLLIAAEVTA